MTKKAAASSSFDDPNKINLWSAIKKPAPEATTKKVVVEVKEKVDEKVDREEIKKKKEEEEEEDKKKEESERKRKAEEETQKKKKEQEEEKRRAEIEKAAADARKKQKDETARKKFIDIVRKYCGKKNKSFKEGFCEVSKANGQQLKLISKRSRSSILALSENREIDEESYYDLILT